MLSIILYVEEHLGFLFFKMPAHILCPFFLLFKNLEINHKLLLFVAFILSLPMMSFVIELFSKFFKFINISALVCVLFLV